MNNPSQTLQSQRFSIKDIISYWQQNRKIYKRTVCGHYLQQPRNQSGFLFSFLLRIVLVALAYLPPFNAFLAISCQSRFPNKFMNALLQDRFDVLFWLENQFRIFAIKTTEYPRIPNFVEGDQFELKLEKELGKPIINKVYPKCRGSGKKYTICIKTSHKSQQVIQDNCYQDAIFVNINLKNNLNEFSIIFFRKSQFKDMGINCVGCAKETKSLNSSPLSASQQISLRTVRCFTLEEIQNNKIVTFGKLKSQRQPSSQTSRIKFDRITSP